MASDLVTALDANAVRGRVRRQKLAVRLGTISGAASASAPAADAGLAVRDAIQHLPVELAEVVRLVHWEGFTLAEVAQLEGIAASTVRSWYARAKDLLRNTFWGPGRATCRYGLGPTKRLAPITSITPQSRQLPE